MLISLTVWPYIKYKVWPLCPVSKANKINNFFDTGAPEFTPGFIRVHVAQS
jgi:hypothetical protein